MAEVASPGPAANGRAAAARSQRLTGHDLKRSGHHGWQPGQAQRLPDKLQTPLLQMLFHGVCGDTLQAQRPRQMETNDLGFLTVLLFVWCLPSFW